MRKNNRGVALAVAVTGALIISIIAVVVLNMTYRSFYLSAFQTDHSNAFYAAEAGVQYAFDRLARNSIPPAPVDDRFWLRRTDGTFVGNTADPNDPQHRTFQQHVTNKGVGVSFIVISDPAVPAVEQGVTYDHFEPSLATGPVGAARTKYVRVRIVDRGAGAPAPRYEVHGEADYGNLPQ